MTKMRTNKIDITLEYLERNNYGRYFTAREIFIAQYIALFQFNKKHNTEHEAYHSVGQYTGALIATVKRKKNPIKRFKRHNLFYYYLPNRRNIYKDRLFNNR